MFKNWKKVYAAVVDCMTKYTQTCLTATSCVMVQVYTFILVEEGKTNCSHKYIILLENKIYVVNSQLGKLKRKKKSK